MKRTKSFKHIYLLTGILSLVSLPAYASQLTTSITPPSTLILNGIPIEEGVFNITYVTSFFAEGDNLNTIEVLLQEDATDDIAVDAIIGSNTSIPLFDIPEETQALHIGGFFEATNPTLIPALANFDITLDNFEITGIPSDFTFFLPQNTDDDPVFQVTDLGTTADVSDNIDSFSTVVPTFTASDGDIVIEGIIPSDVPITSHGGGTVTRTPEENSMLALLGFGSLALLSIKTKTKKAK